MTGECCGRARESAYCPDCGRTLAAATPIMGLLAFVRTTTRAHATRAEHERRSVGCNGGDRDEEYRRRAEQYDRTVEKWQSWAAALEELIARAGGVNS
jgi:hypothetical protein